MVKWKKFLVNDQINRNEELEVVTTLKYESLHGCVETLTKKFENNFTSFSWFVKSSKSSSCITPTSKQDSSCGELKLLNSTKPFSSNKALFEYGQYDPNTKINIFASNYSSNTTNVTTKIPADVGSIGINLNI